MYVCMGVCVRGWVCACLVLATHFQMNRFYFSIIIIIIYFIYLFIYFFFYSYLFLLVFFCFVLFCLFFYLFILFYFIFLCVCVRVCVIDFTHLHHGQGTIQCSDQPNLTSVNNSVRCAASIKSVGKHSPCHICGSPVVFYCNDRTNKSGRVSHWMVSYCSNG